MNTKNKEGKLLLLYDENPMAYIAIQAVRKAISSNQRILDIIPTELHQRIPFF
ncbi:hypothetical protein [Mariniflexile fucanivorans]|uniref:hypothetical protein n=1 Tax=Mariniflexile fucanivorans TaxID=264023 RepID=UPI002939128F|nr:hypothetical protein [Mariniflexile fucanivorans]